MISIVFLSTMAILLIIIQHGPNYLRKRRKIIELLEQFNGLPMKPIIGNAWEFMGTQKDLLKTILTWVGKYKFPLKIWIFNIPIIAIEKPEDIQIIASKNLKKDPIYKYMADLLGDGLITCSFEKWKVRRRIIGPMFSTVNVIKNSMPVFNKNSLLLVKNLEKECETGSEINILTYLVNSAFKSVCENTTGLNATLDLNDSIIDTIFDAATLIGRRMYTPLLYPSLLFKIYKFLTGNWKSVEKVRAFFHKVTELDRKYKGKLLDEKPRNLLEVILQVRDNSVDTNQYDISEELTDDLLTILMAGFDSISVTSSWTFIMLAMNPEFQDKAFSEMDEIFGNSDRMPTRDDLGKMLYLEQCIKESLRLSSFIPIILRYSDEDISITDGRTIPAGVKIAICPYVTHRDSSLYPNPYTFNPDNFTPDKIENRHPYAFLPFGVGLRNCVGSKYSMIYLKVIVSTFLRNFIVTTTMKEEDMEWDYQFALRLMRYPIKLQYRHGKSIFSTQ